MKKKTARTVALIMALVMIYVMLAACSAGAQEAVSNVDIGGKTPGQVLLDAIWKLVELAIAVAGALLTYFVKTTAVPFIENVVVPWLKEKRLYARVKQGVQFVEQMAKNGKLQELLGCPVDGDGKKKYLIKLLQRCGIEVTEEVDAMIESAVYEMNQAAKKAAKEALDGLLMKPADGEEETTE